MLRRVSIGTALLLASACGNYYGTQNLGISTSTNALSDGAGDCANVENCINLDISSTAVLTRGEWTLGRKNNDASNYVKIRNGASLFIEPGTTIKGLANTALIVTQGSQLYAEGEPEAPIVFTSAQPVGQRTSGSWGGVLLLGNAIINQTGGTEIFEALPSNDVEGSFGGTDDNDSSGVLRYVRVEFAGFTYAENAEFNGITFAGVGRGTRVDHIQVHRSSDDGVEFFGGAVDLKYLVSSQNEDDGFDTDNGYRGRAQYVVVQHINGRTADPNGYESDDQPPPPEGNYNALPRTQPSMWNCTLIGTKDTGVNGTPTPSYGAVLRRGTSGLYGNQIWMNFRNAAIDIRDTATTAGFPSILSISHSVFFNNADGANFPTEATDNDGGFIEGTELLAAQYNNVVADPRLASPISLTAPNFLPAAVIAGGSPPTDDFFDANGTFVGAMGTDDWTAGWTSYPEN